MTACRHSALHGRPSRSAIRTCTADTHVVRLYCAGAHEGRWKDEMLLVSYLRRRRRRRPMTANRCTHAVLCSRRIFVGERLGFEREKHTPLNAHNATDLLLHDFRMSHLLSAPRLPRPLLLLLRSRQIMTTINGAACRGIARLGIFRSCLRWDARERAICVARAHGSHGVMRCYLRQQII